MNRFYLTLFGLLVIGTALLPLACSYPPSYPPNYGGPTTHTPTPTSTIPPVVLYQSSLHYSTTSGGAALSTPLTISVGQGVAWDGTSNTGHPLYVDNMNSTCIVNNNTAFPVTVVFPSAGDYLAHCLIHGNCNGGASNSSCPSSNCTGEAVTIHVQ